MNVQRQTVNMVRGGSPEMTGSVGRGGQVGKPHKSFGQKLAGFAKGVASIGLNVVGAALPGGNILAQGLQSALGAQGGSFGDTPNLSGGDMVAKMQKMNESFLALQETTQMQSRQFQTLSNASKARHDIAMNAIRNMKG